MPESYTNSSSYVFVKLLDPRGVRNSSTTTIEFELQQCGCHRALDINLNSEKQYSNNKSSDNNHIYFENTTCSMDAFRRGPSQKIVGFSFYGDINSEKRWVQSVFLIFVELNFSLSHCVGTVPTEWVQREHCNKILTFFIKPLKKNLNGEKILWQKNLV